MKNKMKMPGFNPETLEYDKKISYGLKGEYLGNMNSIILQGCGVFQAIGCAASVAACAATCAAGGACAACFAALVL